MIKLFKNFLQDEDGLGTVEIVVIIAVLVGIALIFRTAIFGFVKMSKREKQQSYPLLLMMLVSTGAYVLLYGEDRYAVSLHFFELMLASVAIYKLAANVRCKMKRLPQI